MYSLGAKSNIVVMTVHAGGLQDRLLMGVTGGLDRALPLCRVIFCLKALGQYINGIWLRNLNTAITEQVNGNSTT